MTGNLNSPLGTYLTPGLSNLGFLEVRQPIASNRQCLSEGHNIFEAGLLDIEIIK